MNPSFNTFSVSTSATCGLCPPTSGLVGALEQPLHCCLCHRSAAGLHRPCRVTEESASCMWHSLRPRGGVVVEKVSLHCWSLISSSMKSSSYCIFMSWRLSSICAHLHQLVCWVFFLTLFFFFFLHLFECANGKLNGWGSLLSFSFTTLFQFSLCPSLSSTARSSALLGMAWHHFVYSSLLLWFLKNSFFDLFIFLFRVLFSLLFLSGMSERILVWHYCTIADIFLLAVGFFFFFSLNSSPALPQATLTQQAQHCMLITLTSTFSLSKHEGELICLTASISYFTIWGLFFICHCF